MDACVTAVYQKRGMSVNRPRKSRCKSLEARELAVQHSVGPRGPISGRSEGDRRPQVEATLELGKAERVVRERAGPQQIRKAGGDSRVMGFRNGERSHR